MIPELMVFHLEDKEAKHRMGANWKGRKTPPFNPSAANQKAIKGYT